MKVFSLTLTLTITITATEQSSRQSGKSTAAGGPFLQCSGLLCEGSQGMWFLPNHFLLLERAPGRRLCQAQGNLFTIHQIEFPFLCARISPGICRLVV